MRLREKQAKENDDKEKPTKSICEKAETRKKGKKNPIFWIRKEREKQPEKVNMFSSGIFKHLQNT